MAPKSSIPRSLALAVIIQCPPQAGPLVRPARKVGSNGRTEPTSSLRCDHMIPFSRVRIPVLIFAVTLASCGGGGGGGENSPPPAPQSQTLIFASASLTAYSGEALTNKA